MKIHIGSVSYTHLIQKSHCFPGSPFAYQKYIFCRLNETRKIVILNVITYNLSLIHISRFILLADERRRGLGWSGHRHFQCTDILAYRRIGNLNA